MVSLVTDSRFINRNSNFVIVSGWIAVMMKCLQFASAASLTNIIALEMKGPITFVAQGMFVSNYLLTSIPWDLSNSSVHASQYQELAARILSKLYQGLLIISSVIK